MQYSPPWYGQNSPDRVPLTEASKRDITDPLSAFLMPAPVGANPVGPAACNRRVPVFDGYTRFDVTLELRRGQGDPHPRLFRAGDDLFRALYPDRRAQAGRQGDPVHGQQQGHEYLARPVPHLPMVVPYRVSLMTMAGTAVIEAAELRFAP